jgi:hypothetical protein
MERTKFCFVYCGDGICDCMPVDYPCDVEPPYYEEVKDDNSTEPTVAPEQSPTPSSNTAG